MPAPEYETRTDSVLAWKKAQKLGRFDPNAPSIEQQKILASEREVDERGKSHPVVSCRLIMCSPYDCGSQHKQKQTLVQQAEQRCSCSFRWHCR